MALRRWDPFSEMTSLRQAIDRLFAESYVDVGGAPTWNGMPPAEIGNVAPVDLIDRDDALIVLLSLPGAKPDDVEISVHRNTLTVQGELRGEFDQGDGRYRIRERWQGRFVRTIPLPVEVSADTCDATFQDGVLRVTLPKSERSRGTRISVRSGRQALDGEASRGQSTGPGNPSPAPPEAGAAVSRPG